MKKKTMRENKNGDVISTEAAKNEQKEEKYSDVRLKNLSCEVITESFFGRPFHFYFFAPCVESFASLRLQEEEKKKATQPESSRVGRRLSFFLSLSLACGEVDGSCEQTKPQHGNPFNGNTNKQKLSFKSRHPELKREAACQGHIEIDKAHMQSPHLKFCTVGHVKSLLKKPLMHYVLINSL